MLHHIAERLTPATRVNRRFILGKLHAEDYLMIGTMVCFMHGIEGRLF
jgi:hypothetical protein